MSTEASLSSIVSIPITEKRTEYSLENAGNKSFRFLHVSSLLNDKTLAVSETKKLPKNEYACVSYPWTGLPFKDDGDDDEGVILVPELVPPEAISVSILTKICHSALALNVEYLWLDKLCIRQDEGKLASDKQFQIPHMYDIYANCKVCFAIPGGLFQMPDIDQSTPWIDRAWTLQEALAPQDVRVLFKWNEGPKQLAHTSAAFVEETAPGVGMVPLRDLLICNLKGSVKVVDFAYPTRDNAPTCEVNLLTGRDKSGFAMKALLGAIDHTNEDGRLHAIWRCLIMRSSRHKEDLIFSSMGIMGVTVSREGINPETGYTDIEVTQLLVRFIKALAANGRRAEWLGIAPSLGPAIGYSALPPLPLARNLGVGFIRDTQDPTRIIPRPGAGDGWWSLSGAPHISIVHDETGDSSFKTRFCAAEKIPSAQIEPSTASPDNANTNTSASDMHNVLHNISTTPNSQWILHPNPGSDPNPNLNDHTETEIRSTSLSSSSSSFALTIGTKEYYLNGNFGSIHTEYPTLVMLVTKIDSGDFESEGQQDRYRNEGYAWMHYSLGGEWDEKVFRVGG